uniref:Rho-GAP domain-containing protein n=1 Tax=Heterorhabditis bacteriophora TaxID=37862 RepID=A0A1I7WLR0_HETBA
MGSNLLEAKIMVHIEYLEHHLNAEIGGLEVHFFSYISVLMLLRYLKTRISRVLDMHQPLAYCVGNIIQDIVLGKSYPYGDSEFLEFKELIDMVLKDTASVSMMLANIYPWMINILPVAKRFLRNGLILQKW